MAGTLPLRPNAPILMWFRRDLRLADNPALCAALEAAAHSNRPLLCCYLLDQSEARALGGASLWWLHHSLTALEQDLVQRGGHLILRRGDPAQLLPTLITETGASALYLNQPIGPGAETARDLSLYQTLSAQGIGVHRFNGTLLHRPDSLRTKSGTPFKVFTPFWKTLRATLDPGPVKPAPDKIPSLAEDQIPASEALEAWGLLPTKPDWAGGLRDSWNPGEQGAMARLHQFLDGPVQGYKEQRNRPDLEATSRLSPHLRFGEISPRQIWTAAINQPPSQDLETFLSEVAWREFSHHLLAQSPEMATQPIRAQFAAFPWREDPEGLSRWQRGQTGYPIVDAGMRELWSTGWMHNRVRMIVASFLVKNLLIPWQAGEAWFWDTLVDACPANNTASWQWVAGCGADAAPYFRIFNPVLQGEKFDPQGAYVRRWVPELTALPDRYIHKPWEADFLTLSEAGVRLDKTYPAPMVEHRATRDRALAALATISAPKGEKAA
ncbi:MAG: cryptochrome/photolyase family protein [Rhodospirillaceae bacterium]